MASRPRADAQRRAGAPRGTSGRTAGPTWGRRLRRLLAALALLAVTAGLVVSVFADELLGPLVLAELRRLAAEEGYTLQVGSLRGVLAHETRLSSVALVADAPSDPFRSATVEHLDVAVSAWGLLQGRDDAVERVLARGVTLEFSADTPDGEGPVDETLFEVPVRLPAMLVDGLSVRLVGPAGTSIALREARLRVAPSAGGAQTVQMDGNAVAALGLPEAPLRGPIVAQGAWRDGVVRLDVRHVEDGARFGSLVVELPTAARGALHWDASVETLGGALACTGAIEAGDLRARLQAHGLSLGDGAALVDPAGAREGRGPAGTLDAEGELTLPHVFVSEGLLARARATLRLTADGLRVPDAVVRAARVGPDGARVLGPRRAELTIGLDAGALTLSDGLLETPGGRLLLRHGRVTLDAPTLAEHVLELDGEADFPDLSALGAVLGGPSWGGRLGGTVRVGGPLSEQLAQVRLVGEDVVVAGRELGRVDVAARADRRTLEIESLHVDGAALRLDVSGRVLLADAELQDVVVRGELSGAPPLLPWVEGPLALYLEASGSALDPTATLALDGESLRIGGVALHDLRVRAQHAPGRLELASLDASGDDGTLSVSGWVAHEGVLPRTARLDRLVLGHGDAQMSLLAPVDAALEDGELHATPLALEGSGGRLELSWDAPVPDPSARGEVRVTMRALQPPPLLTRHLPGGLLGGLFDGELVLHDGTDASGAPARVLSGELRAQALRGVLPGTDATLVGDASLALELSGTRLAPRGTVTARGVGLWLEHGGGRREGPGEFAAELLLDGGMDVRTLRLVGPGGMTLVGSGRVDGLHLGAPLDLRLQMAETDIAFLGSLVGDVRRIAGRVGADVAVHGTLGAPVVTGSLVLGEGELRLANAFPPLDAVTARVTLAQDGARLESLQGELGGSPFTASGTLVRTPGGPRLAVSLRGDDLLMYRGPGVKVRADADLEIAGPPDALTATGTLVLRHCRLARHINVLHLAQGGGPARRRGLQLFSFTEPPLDTLSFDVRVRSDEPFVLDTNVVAGGLRPELRLTGTGRTPVLIGTVFVEPSRVALPGGKVNVDSGRILFDPADPFVPTLRIDASARQRGHDITITVTGPYDQPVVTLSSVPPLPTDQLLLLVLTGQPPADESFGGAGSGSERFAVYIGQDLMARWLGSEGGAGADGVLDRLEFEVASDVTVSGEDSMQVSYRLTDQPREEGPITSLRAERDVYDKVNYGVQFLVRRP